SACDRHCKTAILMILAGLDAEQAKKQLANHNGFIRSALV
ncbi:N-acetylmuramic acid 6-phosphate etherase, partial [Psychrobacter sp. Ps6]|nr:N-acetylmuramic acid 6-phosphate etherase [Psychrobacter sp. Ps6]